MSTSASVNDSRPREDCVVAELMLGGLVGCHLRKKLLTIRPMLSSIGNQGGNLCGMEAEMDLGGVWLCCALSMVSVRSVS